MLIDIEEIIWQHRNSYRVCEKVECAIFFFRFNNGIKSMPGAFVDMWSNVIPNERDLNSKI